MAVDENNYEKAIFVSYAWGGESERTVDELEQSFNERGIQIVRDKKDLGYKGSIEEFEKRIGNGQCVVLVISDKYLRSRHCMYELIEVEKNLDLQKRIFPIVLADASIYKPVERLAYIKYWDEQINQLNQAIKQVSVMTNLAGITADLDRYARIRANFDHLIDLLNDMNALTPEIRAASGYSTVVNAVEREIVWGKTTKIGNKLSDTDKKKIEKSSLLLRSQIATLNENLGGEIKQPPGFLIRRNPFICGRPVQADEFINREYELRTVFNRLRNGESTAIVGEPHIGKTSFLIQIADKKTQMSYLGDDAKSLVISHFNFQYIKNDFAPTIFWEKSLGSFRNLILRENMALRLAQLGKTGYSSDSLDEFFNFLDEQGLQLILILDEFELLLIHSNFQEFEFYATLRAVAQYRSCSLILASRKSLAELQERVHTLPYSGGSPVFNYLTELRLKPFDNKNVGAILARAGNVFSPDDKLLIQFTAGHNPYLVQTMAACLIETTGNRRRQIAIEQFCDSTRSHFDDLWYTLQDRERTTLIILGLVECGKCKFGERFDYSEIQNLANLGVGLHILLSLGLAERVDNGQQTYRRCLIWQGERWTLGSQVLVCWVYQVVIARTHSLKAFDDWLRNEGYISLIKPEQWQSLVDKVQFSTGHRICSVGLTIENKFEQENGDCEDAAAS